MVERTLKGISDEGEGKGSVHVKLGSERCIVLVIEASLDKLKECG